MKIAAWITLIYGFLLIIGGIIGYIQAASTISLIMGICFSILIFLAAIGMFKDRLLPCYLGIILILILDAFFTYRWLFTFKFFPAGLMSIISMIALIAVAILVRNHLRGERNKGK